MNRMLRTALLVITVFLFGAMLMAQDTSVLRPPAGSKVAIVVFEDLQCPDCARAEPLLVDAVKNYKIPLVRHDFPLPQHNWSYDAHVMARYFDSKSPKLGEDFRHYIFMNQPSITKQNLRGVAERFAEEHKVALPFVVDPKGEFAAKVQADFGLGQRVGIQHTPTIYVVSNTQRGTPFVEVADRAQLFQLIDQMMKEAAPIESPKAAPKKAGAKSAAKKPATKQ